MQCHRCTYIQGHIKFQSEEHDQAGCFMQYWEWESLMYNQCRLHSAPPLCFFLDGNAGHHAAHFACNHFISNLSLESIADRADKWRGVAAQPCLFPLLSFTSEPKTPQVVAPVWGQPCLAYMAAYMWWKTCMEALAWICNYAFLSFTDAISFWKSPEIIYPFAPENCLPLWIVSMVEMVN